MVLVKDIEKLDKINEQLIFNPDDSEILAYISENGDIFRIKNNDWYILTNEYNYMYWSMLYEFNVKGNDYRCFPLNNIRCNNNILYLEDNYTGRLLGNMEPFNSNKSWNWNIIDDNIDIKMYNIIDNIPIKYTYLEKMDEYRLDPYNYKYYTKEKFINYYNNTIEWDIMSPTLILKRNMINNALLNNNYDNFCKKYLLDKLIDTFI